MDNLNIENMYIDYNKVKLILDEQRKESMKYLENMLLEITKG